MTKNCILQQIKSFLIDFVEFYIVIVLFDVVGFQLAMGEFFLKRLQNSLHWEKLWAFVNDVI